MDLRKQDSAGIASPQGHAAGHTAWETAAVVAGSLILLIPYYHLPLSDADEGLIAVGAERILRGQIPYRDFFSELGPASFYLQALIFKLGTVSVASLRLTTWLLGGTISGLIYMLARRLMSVFRAVLAASIFFLVCYPFAYNLSHHWWANLFLLLTILSLAVAVRTDEKVINTRARVWLILAGVLAATTLLAMQPKGVWAIVMSVAFLAVEPWLARQVNTRTAIILGLRQSSWFLLGAMVAIGLIVGYFVSQGACSGWVEDNLLFLLYNYRTYNQVPQNSALQTIIREGRLAVTQPSGHFTPHFVVYVFFLLLAPAVAFGGTAWQLLSPRRRRAVEAPLLLLFLAEGIGAYFSEYHSPDVYHAVWTGPPILILFVYQWGLATRNPGPWGRAAKGLALVATGLMLALGGHTTLTALRIDEPVETRRGVVYVRRPYAQDTREVINAIQRRVPPGGETFFYPYVAELYFLTDTRNPTRFDVLLPGFHSEAQIEEAVERLRSSRPSFIFSFDKTQRWTFRPHFPDDPPDVVGPHPVEKALLAPDSGYHIVATIPSGYTTGFRPPGRVAEMEVWGGDSRR